MSNRSSLYEFGAVMDLDLPSFKPYFVARRQHFLELNFGLEITQLGIKHELGWFFGQFPHDTHDSFGNVIQMGMNPFTEHGFKKIDITDIVTDLDNRHQVVGAESPSPFTVELFESRLMGDISEGPDGQLWMYHHTVNVLPWFSEPNFFFYILFANVDHLIRINPRTHQRTMTFPIVQTYQPQSGVLNETGHYVPVPAVFDYHTSYLHNPFSAGPAGPTPIDPSGNAWIPTYDGAARINKDSAAVDLVVPWPSEQPPIWNLDVRTYSSPASAGDAMFDFMVGGRTGMLLCAHHTDPPFKRTNAVDETAYTGNYVFNFWHLPWGYDRHDPRSSWHLVLSYTTSFVNGLYEVLHADNGNPIGSGAGETWWLLGFAGPDLSGTSSSAFLPMMLTKDAVGAGSLRVIGNPPGYSYSSARGGFQLGNVVHEIVTHRGFDVGLSGDGFIEVMHRYSKGAGAWGPTFDFSTFDNGEEFVPSWIGASMNPVRARNRKKPPV